MKVKVVKSFVCGVHSRNYKVGDIVNYPDDVAERRVNKNKVAVFLKEEKQETETKEEKATIETKGRGRPRKDEG